MVAMYLVITNEETIYIHIYELTCVDWLKRCILLHHMWRDWMITERV